MQVLAGNYLEQLTSNIKQEVTW